VSERPARAGLPSSPVGGAAAREPDETRSRSTVSSGSFAVAELRSANRTKRALRRRFRPARLAGAIGDRDVRRRDAIFGIHGSPGAPRTPKIGRKRRTPEATHARSDARRHGARRSAPRTRPSASSPAALQTTPASAPPKTSGASRTCTDGRGADHPPQAGTRGTAAHHANAGADRRRTSRPAASPSPGPTGPRPGRPPAARPASGPPACRAGTARRRGRPCSPTPRR